MPEVRFRLLAVVTPKLVVPAVNTPPVTVAPPLKVASEDREKLPAVTAPENVADVPVSAPANEAVPLTDSIEAGAFVPIPTFPLLLR